jgi:hypothetical protein
MGPMVQPIHWGRMFDKPRGRTRRYIQGGPLGRKEAQAQYVCEASSRTARGVGLMARRKGSYGGAGGRAGWCVVATGTEDQRGDDGIHWCAG